MKVYLLYFNERFIVFFHTILKFKLYL